MDKVVPEGANHNFYKPWIQDYNDVTRKSTELSSYSLYGAYKWVEISDETKLKLN